MKRTATTQTLPLRVWIELGVICLLGMESLWLACFYRHFSGISLGFGLVVCFLWGIGLASHYLARGLNRLVSHLGLARLILLAWLLGCLLLALKGMVFPDQSLSLGELAASPVTAFLTEGRDAREFWTLAFTLGMVLRAIGLARRPMEHAALLFSFQFGLFALLGFGWLLAPALQSQAIFSLVGVIFLGLVSIFSYKMVRRIADFGNQVAALNTWWTRNMLVMALLMAFGGAALGWLLYLLAPPLMQALWALIKLLVGVLSLAIITLVQAILNIILELLRATHLSEAATSLFNRLQQFAQQVSAWSDENMRATQDPANVGLWIAFGVVVLGVGLFFIIRRWRAAAQRSLGSGRPDWYEALPAFPQKQLPFGTGRAPRRMPAAERVRFIYSQLMDLCEKLESPRAMAVTPLEFLPALHDLFPDNIAESELITQAYLRVRYGQFPEDKDNLRLVTRAWEDLSRAGERYFLARKNLHKSRRFD